MIKHIMALALTVIAVSPFYTQGAVTYPSLTFTLTDNSEVSVPSENLQMTYTDGALHLSSATVDQTLPLSSLKSMRFVSLQSGIDIAETEANAPVEVFNTVGVKVGIFPTVEDAANVLPHGAYIIRSGKTSKKVMF